MEKITGSGPGAGWDLLLIVKSFRGVRDLWKSLQNPGPEPAGTYYLSLISFEGSGTYPEMDPKTNPKIDPKRYPKRDQKGDRNGTQKDTTFGSILEHHILPFKE